MGMPEKQKDGESVTFQNAPEELASCCWALWRKRQTTEKD